MLTKGDISAIGKIIDQKIEPLVKGQADISKGQANLVKGQADLVSNQSDLVEKYMSLDKNMKRGFRKVNRDSGVILDILEKEDRNGMPLVN